MASPGCGRFVGYVGPWFLHDGRIVAVERVDARVDVVVKPCSGRPFIARFSGVQSVTMEHPVGMLLYSLSEMEGCGPLRRFVFSNWDDEDPARLEILALDVTFPLGE